jgi:hypothetical protein
VNKARFLLALSLLVAFAAALRALAARSNTQVHRINHR